ncbi:hypothetical protein U91I_01265 [alpha proteobacterium U9-1i]|nr:hypothetical protein U91I_01265 [alpha proteobacterium U9-1i]
MRKLMLAVSVAAVCALGACGDSAEEAGENLDSQIEQTTTGEVNSSDGAFEQAGEAIDEASGKQNNDPADALSDATDGDRSTTP